MQQHTDQIAVQAIVNGQRRHAWQRHYEAILQQSLPQHDVSVVKCRDAPVPSLLPLTRHPPPRRSPATRRSAAVMQVSVVFTERAGHAVELARDAAQRGGVQVVAVAGGDGTLSEVCVQCSTRSRSRMNTSPPSAAK